MKHTAALLALCLGAAACRPAPDGRPEPLPPAAAPAAELQRRYAWLSELGHDDRRTQEIVVGLRFDSISLQRSRCYGSCPVYRVALRRDLSATYQGEANVERIGTWHAGVWIDAYGRLSYLIERLDVIAMDSSYARPITDMPTATLRIWPRGAARPKVISDYGSAGPPELWAVMEMVDAIAADTRWTRSRPAS
jgi:hypothetical protein